MAERFIDHKELGVAALLAGDNARAAEELKQAVAIDAEDPDLLLNLAIAYARLEQGDAALYVLETLFALNSGFTDVLRAYQLQIFLLMRAGRYADAGKVFVSVLERFPHNRALLELRAFYLEKTGDIRGALKIVGGLLDQFPDDPHLINSFAFLTALNGQPAGYSRALSLIARALRRKPGHPAYLDTFGVLLARTGRTEAAEQALKKALDRMRRMAPAYRAEQEVIMEHLRQVAEIK